MSTAGTEIFYAVKTHQKNVPLWVPFGLIVAVGCGLLYGMITNGQNWGDDFAAYIMQARSLTDAAPQAFIDANRVSMEHSSYAIGPNAYPWGFPVLLAPFYAVFGLNMIALKAVGGLAYVLFLVLLWFGFRGIHPPFWFLCLASLFAFNPALLAFSNNIMSDLPFLLVSTLGMVLIKAWVVEERTVISRGWDAALIGIVIAGAFFIRTNGVLLIAALGVSQIVCGRQKHPLVVRLLPYAVFFCLVMAWEVVLPNGGASHLSLLKNISVKILVKNLYYYLTLPSAFFSGVPYPYLPYMASLPFAIAGAMKRQRSDCHAIVYVVLTFFLYVIWPSPSGQGLRFLFPILPFYVSFVLSGLEAVQGGGTVEGTQLRKRAGQISVMFVICCFGVRSAHDVYENLSRNRTTLLGPYTATSQSLISFVAEHTEAESTIIFFKPRLMNLMTNRKSIMINNRNELSRGNYLCLYLRVDTYGQVSPSMINQLHGKGIGRLVYENSDFRMYRLRE